MAALLKNKSNGRYSIQFRAADGSGRRPVIRIGKASKAEAENWRAHVDHLNAATAAKRAPDLATVQWLATLAPKRHAKLVKCGLIPEREGGRPIPIGPYFRGYIDKRTDLKPRTRTNLEQAKGKLEEKFKADRDIRTITRGDAKDWRRKLGETLSPATVATHIKKARQVFQDAVDHKLIPENPFAGVKAGKQTNKKRQFYVTPEAARKVTDAATSIEWRTLFALARFGGLRVPSETSLLKWTDVDFEAARFHVHSPKTEHHEGRAARMVPIFPDLRPYLEAARAAAAPDAQHVLGRLRAENPRTTTMKMVKRAGLKVWPRLFQNLRSSCQTDLESRGFTTNVVCGWLGNTPEVARAHYLQVTDDDFRAAAGGSQSAAKSVAGGTGQERTCPDETPGKPHISRENGTLPIPPRGVHRVLNPSTCPDIPEKSAAGSAANGDLAHVTRAGRIAVSAGRGPDLRKSLSKIARATRRATAKGGAHAS